MLQWIPVNGMQPSLKETGSVPWTWDKSSDTFSYLCAHTRGRQWGQNLVSYYIISALQHYNQINRGLLNIQLKSLWSDKQFNTVKSINTSLLMQEYLVSESEEEIWKAFGFNVTASRFCLFLVCRWEKSTQFGCTQNHRHLQINLYFFKSKLSYGSLVRSKCENNGCVYQCIQVLKNKTKYTGLNWCSYLDISSQVLDLRWYIKSMKMLRQRAYLTDESIKPC